MTEWQDESGELDWPALGRWMGLAQQGDSAAYRRLLKELVPYLRRLAARRLSPADEVEDLVQDILMSVHIARRTYDSKRPLRPWIDIIAARRLADRLRRRYRIGAVETPLRDDIDETFAQGEANEHRGTDMRPIESGGALGQAIAGLPPSQRQAVELLRLRELSLKEAAALSGRSETALKVAMHRAVKALRLILEPKQ
jgi:RNA polymerase sigma-70 factor, ECF subfamily